MRVPSNINRRATAPINVKRSNRLHNLRGITSMPAGKMVPLAAIPLVREDSVRSGNARVTVEMMETYEVLLNSVNVRVMAYLVPTLAFDRFQGSMDVLNRSFKGQPPLDGETVIPFFESHTFRDGVAYDEDREVYKYLGLHGKGDALVNTDYLEAYNQIWNFRASQRSKDLTLRERLDDTLAPAFWMHEQFAHIVPDFDQAAIDGEVALNVVSGISDEFPVVSNGGYLRIIPEGGGDQRNIRMLPADNNLFYGGGAVGSATNALWGDSTGLKVDLQALTEELTTAGFSLSLSNIELAKKTQTFAKLRQKYEGHSDEWLIDMLMSGLSVPDQALKQPMMLYDSRAPFRQKKRYASDGASLTESVVNGMTSVDIALRLPRLPTGGVIMIVAEALPDQLFERRQDIYFHMTQQPSAAGSAYPDYLRDELDPEKVEIVTNGMVDIDHTNPTDTFGYGPLNWRWNYDLTAAGGRYYAPAVDGGSEEARQRFWAEEIVDPVLSEDFYICTSIGNKPFVVSDQDPFEAVVVGSLIINGNTVFGGKLIEASESYDKVLEKAPQERLQKIVDEE